MDNQKPVRIGVLGAARIAPMALLKPARKVAGAEVVAIAARDPARAGKMAASHGIARVHETYDALLADAEIDAVYIPLPVAMHAEWSIRALRAGKHVLCEKPIACNAGEAERMALTAAETGLVLAEAHHSRYHPLYARIKEIADSGELGAVRHIEANLCVPLVFRDDVRYRYDMGGGATMDVGVYALHLCRFIAGEEPEVVSAQAALSSPQVDRWMKAELKFPSGRTGRIFCSIFSIVLLRSNAKVFGQSGEMFIANPYQPQMVHHAIKVKGLRGTRREKLPGFSSYDCQLEAFVRAVRGDAPMPTGPADFVANMRVIDAVYEKAGLKPRGT